MKSICSLFLTFSFFTACNTHDIENERLELKYNPKITTGTAAKEKNVKTPGKETGEIPVLYFSSTDILMRYADQNSLVVSYKTENGNNGQDSAGYIKAMPSGSQLLVSGLTEEQQAALGLVP